MANTNGGRQFYIAVTIADGSIPDETPADLDLAGYEALIWQDVIDVGSIGETGTNENILRYDTLSTEVAQKNKGVADAGDPEIEVARSPTDKGQLAMRTAGGTKLYYAFKMVDDDMPQGGTNGTTYYNRGLVAGPKQPNGRREDFVLEVFTLGLVQKQIIKEAA